MKKPKGRPRKMPTHKPKATKAFKLPTDREKTAPIVPKPARKATSTTITWLGEDHLHLNGEGPRFNEWCGVRFEINKPVVIADLNIDGALKELMLRKAGPPFWKKVEPSGNDNPP